MKQYLALGILSVAGMWAQSAPPAGFDVASIKLNAACTNGRVRGSPPSPGTLDMQCTTLENLIRTAYIVFAHAQPDPKTMEILGAPAWVGSDRYDVMAKARGNATFVEVRGPMLRGLLEERFQLKAHRETKEGPVYALTVAKGGPKFQPTKEGSCVPVDLNHLPPPPARGEPMPNYCGTQTLKTNQGRLVLDVHGVSVTDLANGVLSDQLDHRAIDQTGLAGVYDVHLEFAPNSVKAAADSEASSILTALTEQLGLKLSASRGPIEVLVIDHVERPSAN